MIEAVRQGDLDIMVFLMNKDVKLYPEALFHAAYKGNREIIEFMLERGIDIHSENDQALRDAAAGGHMELVKFFLERGANIRATDEDGWGVLMYAVLGDRIEEYKYKYPEDIYRTKGSPEIVSFLLDTCDHSQKQLNRALCIASQGGDLEIVKLLVDHGAYDNNALLRAHSNHHDEVVAFLMNQCSEVDAHKDDLLICAAEHDNPVLVTLLLKREARVSDAKIQEFVKDAKTDTLRILFAQGVKARVKHIVKEKNSYITKERHHMACEIVREAILNQARRIVAARKIQMAWERARYKSDTYMLARKYAMAQWNEMNNYKNEK
jgi:hypothetical protein